MSIAVGLPSRSCTVPGPNPIQDTKELLALFHQGLVAVEINHGHHRLALLLDDDGVPLRMDLAEKRDKAIFACCSLSVLTIGAPPNEPHSTTITRPSQPNGKLCRIPFSDRGSGSCPAFVGKGWGKKRRDMKSGRVGSTTSERQMALMPAPMVRPSRLRRRGRKIAA